MRFSDYQTPVRCNKSLLSGSGVAGDYNAISVDCPFVFRHNNRFFMLHIGFDGIGYRTALAVSDDLLDWHFYGLVLDRLAGSSRWDSVGAAGGWIIRQDDSLSKISELKKIDGKYWLLYHSYPGKGYENGPAEMSFAFCEDEDLKHWQRLPSPVFSWKDGAKWESGGLYRGAVVEKDGHYVMLYNARDEDKTKVWLEQTGIAVSDDLLHWRRMSDNPVLRVTPGGWDSRFVSDPCIVRDGEKWLNFYFGYNGEHAQEGLAWSDDLIHWEKFKEPLLSCGNAGDLDELHAHKASVLRYNGVLYHFYSAVRKTRPGESPLYGNEFRSITLATSRIIS
ncbi:MAG: hypothetical protein PHI35_08870 [Victivallaceae bacterium]|nr:hypothetical protein [Victivallaceae bacterium]